MASPMQVNTQDIENAAKTIRAAADKYQEDYIEIFNRFQQIDAVWDGEDNDVYNEKVMSFKQDFYAMVAFFERLIMHLNLSAAAYKTTESVVTVSAESLNKLKKLK